MGFQCIHLKSVCYSSRALESDTILLEEVLSSMVETKWMSSNTRKLCLERQAEAESIKSPLSKVIEFEFDQDDSKIHVSVLETQISYYARLGRVMVTYDKKRNTWHCPCAKARRSCPHKAIAKWHLNQTHSCLFQKVRSTDTDVATTHLTDTGSAVLEDHDQYPPEGKNLASLVQYLLTSKKIPAKLPKDICSMTTNFPKHLVPLDTTCHHCDVPLLDPMLISQKAKIVTVSGTIEGMYGKMFDANYNFQHMHNLVWVSNLWL